MEHNSFDFKRGLHDNMDPHWTLPTPSGVCQQIVPPNLIVKAVTDLWNRLRALLCGFGFCF
jgi:hypothetical protein